MQYDLFITKEQTQQVQLSIQTPIGAIQHPFSFPDQAITLGAFSRQTMDLCNSLVALACQSHLEETNLPISCSANCGACCRQLVTISVPEALQMGDVIDNLPSGERVDIRDDCEAIAASWQSMGRIPMPRQLSDPTLGEQQHYAIAEDYFSLNVACPFLRGGNCSIYSDRFAICREYLVCSPKECCSAPFTSEVSPISLGFSMRDTLAALAASLLHRQVELIPIPLVPEYLKENEDLRARKFQSDDLMRRFLPLLEVMLGAM